VLNYNVAEILSCVIMGRHVFINHISINFSITAVHTIPPDDVILTYISDSLVSVNHKFEVIV